MLEALILTLREGIEAALVVGIIVSFLRRENARRYLGAVWAGLATAVVASVAGAWMLYRVAVNEEAFEGVLYLASAVAVGTFVIWMWRHSHTVAGQMKGRLARILAGGNSLAVAGGLFAFTFLMVFREGVETMLFLSALSLTTSGLAASFGALIGLGAAVAFGVLFVRGSVKVDLGRFFRITGIALMIFVLQLLFNAYHELSEAGWVPANETTMAVIGPMVRNDFFFILAVILLPLLLVLVPGSKQPEPVAEQQGAAGRLERARERRVARARLAAGTLGVGILVVLTVGFAYSRPVSELSNPVVLTVDGTGFVRVPLAQIAGGELHRFAVDFDQTRVRFIALEIGPGEPMAALDACLLCGSKGYGQDAAGVVCLHCHALINRPTIGQDGGCNPIPIDFEIVDGELRIAGETLRSAVAVFRAPGEHAHHAS